VQQNGHRHDPARAKKLLAEAGYQGQPIKITTNSRFAVMNDVRFSCRRWRNRSAST